jgi:hypothetical protein
MATIPLGQKFHTVPSSVQTVERGSALANSQREIYTMGDIASSVGKFYVNPYGGAVIGPNVGTLEISESILIPANTLATDPAIIELLFRIEKNDSATTGFSCNIYSNTSNSLVGASLLGTVVTGASSKTYSTNVNRTILFKNSQLQVIDSSFAIIDDFVATTGGPVSTIALNSTYDNYIIIAVGASSLTSTSQVTLAKLNINA